MKIGIMITNFDQWSVCIDVPNDQSHVSSEETFYPYSLLDFSSSNFGFMHIKVF